MASGQTVTLAIRHQPRAIRTLFYGVFEAVSIKSSHSL